MLAAGCAQPAPSSKNDGEKQYLESWIQLYHPDAVQTADGSYILEDIPGTGSPVGDPDNYPYLRLNFETRNLKGKITDYSDRKVAEQLGEFAEKNYYGPKTWYRGEDNLPVGLDDALEDMKAGGVRKILIPGWLLTNPKKGRYAKFEDYFKKESGTTEIYTLKPIERIADIEKWELDSLNRWMAVNYPSISPEDTLKKGYFYVRTGEPADTKEFPKDTTFKINYIGRLLNGQVFDTTIRDTAKFYGIYNASSAYEPVEITMAEEYTDIKMGSTTVVDGFSFTISQMHAGEKGRGIFWSAMGYKQKGTGDAIPAYSPLIFDIEILH